MTGPWHAMGTSDDAHADVHDADAQDMWRTDEMSLSPDEKRQLAALERVMSNDAVLAAIAELFTEPTSAQVFGKSRHPGRPVPPGHHGIARWSVLAAVLGVTCSVTGMVLGLVALAAIGIGTTVGAAVSVVIQQCAISSRF